MIGGVKVKGLKEFRSALRRASDANPRELTRGLKEAGRPVQARASSLAPKGPSGRLHTGYKISAQGTRARILNRAPYAGGAEWGMHGKWKGFRRYPGPAPGGRGRFAWRAVFELREQIARSVLASLQEIVTAHGWFHRSR